jgi:protein gp37
MGINTNIEWAHHTLNLWTGCTKVSEGCKFCYAEKLMDGRFGRGNWGPLGKRQEVKSWRANLRRIVKIAKETGERQRVFINSLGDTFEGAGTMGGYDSNNWQLVQSLRKELCEAINKHTELDFLLLTKRPERIVGMFHIQQDPNVWIGTSVEDQKTAKDRIPHLEKVNAKVLFLSVEPLLRPVSIKPWIAYGHGTAGYDDQSTPSSKISWVIIGGESGPGARSMDIEWVRSLISECREANLPVFVKQLGKCPTMGGEPYPVKDAKGGDMSEWPEDLCIRMLPGEQWTKDKL